MPLYTLHNVEIWTGVTDALLTHSQTLKDRAPHLLIKYKSRALVTQYYFCWKWAGLKDLNYVFFVTVFVFDKCDFWWEWAGRKRPWSGHFSTGHRSGANIILPCFDIFKKSIFRFWLYSWIRFNWSIFEGSLHTSPLLYQFMMQLNFFIVILTTK